MAKTHPDFTIGIEEEYLLVDQDSLDLAVAPDGLMAACKADLEGKVSPEFLQCQIEVGTGVCKTIPQARAELAELGTARISHGHQPWAATMDWLARQAQAVLTGGAPPYDAD